VCPKSHPRLKPKLVLRLDMGILVELSESDNELPEKVEEY